MPHSRGWGPPHLGPMPLPCCRISAPHAAREVPHDHCYRHPRRSSSTRPRPGPATFLPVRRIHPLTTDVVRSTMTTVVVMRSEDV